jgi:head-tail adaptor
MRAGRLNRRVSFQRLDSTPDEYGNVSQGTWAELFTTWGNLRETTGREIIEGGAIHAPVSATLMVRGNSLTRTVLPADSAVIDSVRWNIRTITNPDQRGAWLLMVVEREATGI